DIVREALSGLDQAEARMCAADIGDQNEIGRSHAHHLASPGPAAQRFDRRAGCAMRRHVTQDDILSRVLYRDALMLVLDKPAGIAVHAGGAVRGKTLDQYFDALRYGLPRRPELAHRLDRETSGCLVLGRHARSIADLNLMFREGAVGKIYLAVVAGAPPDDEGRIDLKIGPKDKERGWHQKVDEENGLPALTTYRVLGRAKGHALVELNLHTGRTHQLRVHMAGIGCPILGDRIYGALPS